MTTDLHDALRALERTLYVVGRPVPVFKRVVRPVASWEAVEPGRTFPPLEYAITAADVAWYRREVIAPLAGDETLPADDTVPPLFFADEPMQCLATAFSRSGRLHAEHAIEVVQPVPVGSTVRSAAHIAERFERGDRRLYVVACTTSLLGSGEPSVAIRTRATLVI